MSEHLASVGEGPYHPVRNDIADRSHMLRLLIVCIGNPLRSDDGIAWRVGQELSSEKMPDGVQVIATHQLTPEISELASQAEKILFVDAADDGPPGNIKCERIGPGATPLRHSHKLSPEEVLAFCQHLYSRSPAAHLLTIAGESFEPGVSLTPAVSVAADELRKRIRDFIAGH